jgi:hypothetical protein
MALPLRHAGLGLHCMTALETAATQIAAAPLLQEALRKGPAQFRPFASLSMLNMKMGRHLRRCHRGMEGGGGASREGRRDFDTAPRKDSLKTAKTTFSRRVAADRCDALCARF